MKIERIDHLHAYTKDIDAVARLFSGLGLKCEVPDLKDMEGAGGKTLVVWIGEGAFIEFLQPTDPEGDLAQLIGDREEGLLCVDLKVSDMDEAVAEMESRGIKLLKMFEINQLKQAWFDPSNTFGVQIELGEYPGDEIADITKASGLPLRPWTPPED